MDGLEEDVYVEFGEADDGVVFCDFVCEGGFFGEGGEGVGGVVYYPERHCDGC